MTDEPTDDVPEDGIHLEAPPPPDGTLDRARAAAMATFDELHGASASPAPVDDLAGARARRAWYQRVPLGAVAAVLIVIALVGVFALTDLGSSTDEMATAGDDGSGDGTESVETPVQQDAATDDEDAGSAGGTSGDDGASELESSSNRSTFQHTATYDDADELVEALRDRFASAPTADEGGDPDAVTEDQGTAATSTTTGPADGARCDALAAAGIDADVALAIVPATVDGRPVTAVVYETSEGLRVSLVDTSSCSVDDDLAL